MHGKFGWLYENDSAKKPLGSLVMWYNVGQTLFSSDRVGKSEGNERQP